MFRSRWWAPVEVSTKSARFSNARPFHSPNNRPRGPRQTPRASLPLAVWPLLRVFDGNYLQSMTLERQLTLGVMICWLTCPRQRAATDSTSLGQKCLSLPWPVSGCDVAREARPKRIISVSSIGLGVRQPRSSPDHFVTVNSRSMLVL